MFLNFIRVALRNLIREKGISFINILGLAIGYTISSLILLYIVNEISYDRFHIRANDIYRVAVKGAISDQPINYALSSGALAPALMKDFDVVESATRFESEENVLVVLDKKEFVNKHALYIDSSFFNVFNFKILAGEAKEGLTLPNTVVLSATLAGELFENQQPIGKTIVVNQNLKLTIIGVVVDVPGNSHFNFDLLISLPTFELLPYGDRLNDWSNISFYTYLKLKREGNPAYLEKSLVGYWEGKMDDSFAASNIDFKPYLQPIRNIHLHSNLGAELQQNNNILTIYVFAGIAIFVLLMGVINFMNLSTAGSSQRAKEVGIRKIMGSEKRMLIMQFIVESILYSFLSLALSLIFIELLIPFFNSVSGQNFDFVRDVGFEFYIFLILVSFLIGIIAGIYPALFLSKFIPHEVLKGKLSNLKSGLWIRNVFVFVQFTISIVLIIVTANVYSQLFYVHHKSLGFNKENIMVIPLRNEMVKSNINIVIKEFSKKEGVLEVALSGNIPGKGISASAFYPADMPKNKPWLIYKYAIDSNFFKTMDIKILYGKGFSHYEKQDTIDILINKKLADLLEWENPLEKIIFSDIDTITQNCYKVIGVVADFHNRSLYENIDPMLFTFLTHDPNFLVLKLKPDITANSLEQLKYDWLSINPDVPFDHFFLNESLHEFYKGDERMGQILLYFTLLALFISTLGLFGLASYVTSQRTSEIGIRKVLGASVIQIMTLFSQIFIKLLLLSTLLAWPVAYYISLRWLTNYAFKTSFSVWIFIGSTFFALLIALITINLQVLKVVRRSPVHSLRYE